MKVDPGVGSSGEVDVLVLTRRDPTVWLLGAEVAYSPERSGLTTMSTLDGAAFEDFNPVSSTSLGVDQYHQTTVGAFEVMIENSVYHPRGGW